MNTIGREFVSNGRWTGDSHGRLLRLGYNFREMFCRPLRRCVLWLLALWVSLLTPLAAFGCMQACGRVWDDARCCAPETAHPCSGHPCSCEPCPVCSAPKPAPLWAKSDESKTLIHAPIGILTFALTVPPLAARLAPRPEPPFIPPDIGIAWGYSHRAPPVLS